MENTKTRIYYEDMPVDFKRDGTLMRNKLLEYLPIMIITNISNLLLVSVDSLVVGNFLGNDAFATVNIFGPIVTLIGAISTLASTGISTCLSIAIGSNKQEEINRVRGASFYFMWLMVVIASVIQLPIIKFIIDSYHLNIEMNKMVWQYAIGIMMCTPFGIISTVGVYQLEIVGKMKVLMKFSILEGLTNLILDLVFVGTLNMGVAGAGYGTACANIVRASATLIYISHFTNVYKRDGYKINYNDFKEIIRMGTPGFIENIMNAFQIYCMTRILLSVAGTDGCVISGVASFCYALVSVLLNGLQGSMRPLVGLLSGEDDKVGLSELMESGFRICIIGGSVCTFAIMFFLPSLYSINGIKNIPVGGITALRFFSLSFIVEGFNTLINLYLANRKDIVFVSRVDLIGYAFLPFIAFIISKIAPSPYLWLAYVINATLVFIVLYLRYLWWKKNDIEKDYKSTEVMVLYMTVTPDKAITASRAIRKFAGDHNVNPHISNRVALCMEEMVEYADSSKVQIMVRYKGSEAAIFTVLYDGKQINLDIDEEERQLTTNSYEIIRRLSKSYDYQYILDMNYTTIEFETWDVSKLKIKSQLIETENKFYSMEQYKLPKDGIDCSFGYNPYGFPTECVEVMKNFNPSNMGYYPHSETLYDAIFDFWKELASVKKENIILTDGSVNALYIINSMFDNNDTITYGISPQFTDYYKHIEMLGIKYVSYNLDINNNYKFELSEFMSTKYFNDKIDKQSISNKTCDFIYIDNPNNPTGQCINIRAIEKIVRTAIRHNIIVVIDEAFGDFMSKSNSAIKLYDKYPNLIVVRTLSKGFGLPGMRVGYMVAHTNLVECMRKVVNPFMVGEISREVAACALKHEEFIEESKKDFLYMKAEIKKVLNDGGNLHMAETLDTNPLLLLYHNNRKINLKNEFYKLGVLVIDGSYFKGLNSSAVRVRLPIKNEFPVLLNAIKALNK